MPVIEETPLIEQDIDLLASEMKENLKLSSYCVKRTVTRHLYSPYRRESPMDLSKRILRKPSDNNKSKSDDPSDMLQELLNKGCLIQEAVKRLQLRAPKSMKVYESNEENSPPRACVTDFRLVDI